MNKIFSSPSSVIVLILAGGQSRRLFPFNKVLSDLTGKGRTMIQQAYDRSVGPFSKQNGVRRKNFFVLSDPSVVAAMRAQLNLPATQFLSDPVRRGTWPAILWAMAHVRARGPETILAVMTADHLIGDLPRFRRAMTQAIDTARARPALVTVGVFPSRHPDEWRGFGALQTAKASAKAQATPIRQFEEKPSIERASEMIREGRWLWNAGMFFFRLSTAEKALAHYQPESARIYHRLCQAVDTGDQKKAAHVYADFPTQISHPTDTARLVDNTIDYAIVTPIVARPVEGLEAWSAATSLKSWADVGEWTVLKKLVKPDASRNTIVGDVKRARDVKNCIIVADRSHRIEVSGVQNKVIAFSGEKALVLSLAEVPRLKEILNSFPDALIVAPRTEAVHVERRGRQLIVRAKTL